MKIVNERPPMFDEIAAVFPTARNAGVVFSWGDTLYNPSKIEITPALKAHEAVHGQRQGKTDAAIRAWWMCYLEEPAFRLAEEVLAHRGEYRAFCSHNKDRNARAQALQFIASRLASPLYGGMLSYKESRRAIV